MCGCDNEKRCIIIITDNYPYGKGEEFFETELEYIKDNFDKVIIISACKSDILTREVPNNVEVFRFPYAVNSIGKLKSIFFIFNKEFWKEIHNIRQLYNQKVNLNHIKSIFQLMYYGGGLEHYLNKVILKQSLNKYSKLFLYSYWCMSSAYAISNYKIKNIETIAISRAHGYDLYFERNNNNYLPFRKKLVSNLDRIFFISENGKKYFQNKVKVYDDIKLDISRLGINNNFPMNETSFGDEINIVSCSYVVPVKRLDLIIKALAQIGDFKISWTHIGNGPLYDEILEAAAKNLNDKGNISYKFMGHLDNKQVYEFYKNNKVDIFINVSASEGIPVTIMEACSFGIPIIATNVGGVSEIVNNSNGILLNENPKIEEIHNAINFFRRLDKDSLYKLKTNSYKMWNENYNAQKNYSNLINEILEIIPNVK